MTKYDLLKMNVSVIKVFLRNKVWLEDVDNLGMLEEYLDRRNAGEKYSYVVETLGREYGVSARHVGRIVRRLREEVAV